MVSNAAVPVTRNHAYTAGDQRVGGGGLASAGPSFSPAGALLDAYLASRKRLAAPALVSNAQQSTQQSTQQSQSPAGQPQHAPTGTRPLALQGTTSGNALRRVVLLFRQHYRVSLSEHGDGQILISARIVSLPEAGPRRDAMLVHIGKLGLGLATRYGAACVIDASEQAVWLQDRQAPDGKTVDLALRVRGFVNALATWQKTLDRIHF